MTKIFSSVFALAVTLGGALGCATTERVEPTTSHTTTTTETTHTTNTTTTAAPTATGGGPKSTVIVVPGANPPPPPPAPTIEIHQAPAPEENADAGN